MLSLKQAVEKGKASRAQKTCSFHFSKELQIAR